MKTDRVRSVRRAEAEHANVTCFGQVPWVGTQDISPGEMKPRDNDDSVADLNIPNSIVHLRIEHQPSLRCALVTLSRGVDWVH